LFACQPHGLSHGRSRKDPQCTSDDGHFRHESSSSSPSCYIMSWHCTRWEKCVSNSYTLDEIKPTQNVWFKTTLLVLDYLIIFPIRMEMTSFL
jgi:hypothetical protein